MDTPPQTEGYKGEGFAVDASVMEANAGRYRGKAPDEIVWADPERQTRAVKEYPSHRSLQPLILPESEG